MTKDQMIEYIISYLKDAKDWDVCETAEWIFGYDDPIVEKFRTEKCLSTQTK